MRSHSVIEESEKQPASDSSIIQETGFLPILRESFQPKEPETANLYENSDQLFFLDRI